MRRPKFRFRFGYIVFPLVSAFSTFLTIFFFASSLEIVFAQDIHHSLASISKYPSSQLVDTLTKDMPSSVSKATLKQYHRLESLRVNSDPVLKVGLLEAKKVNDIWLLWQGKAHFLVESENPQAGIGNTYIFLQNDWRTSFDQEDLKINTLFSLDTSTYRNTYKIIENYSLELSDDPLITKLDVPHVLILVHNQADQTNFLVKAIFISQLNLEE